MRSFGELARGFATAVALAGLACGGEARSASPPQARTSSPKSTAATNAEFTVEAVTVRLPLELPAQLYVEHDAFVVARTSGSIDSLFAELGDRVSAGQLLARLESGEQQIALAGADASRDNAQRAAVRSRILTKSGGSTSADSEQVEFQLRQSEIAQQKARRDFELTKVIAPFQGVVTARLARSGRYVAVGDTLFRITEQAPLFARVRVPEASAKGMRIGGEAAVLDPTGQSRRATVVHTAPFIDAASGTREVVLRVGDAPAEWLVGGGVVVRIGGDARQALSVPRDAIAAEGYAVVVDSGRTSLRPVTLGRDLGGGRVEVVSGLAAGERLARPGR